MSDSCSCISFISESGFFDNAVTSIADVRHIVMTISWCLETSLRSVTSTLRMAYRDILYNQCISNTWKFSIFIFPRGRIRVCEIRFASTDVICGNTYPVCKNVRVYLSRIWGVDRKFRPEGYCLASRGLPSEVRLLSRGRIFLSVPHIHDRYFFLHIFHFWKWLFDNAVTSTIADVRHTEMTIS